MLSQFAEFEELLSALVAREHSGTSVARTWKLRVASTSMPGQPTLSCEGLKASGGVTVEHCKPVCPGSQCQRLHPLVCVSNWGRHSSLFFCIGRCLWRQDHLYVVQALHVHLQLLPLFKLLLTLRTLPHPFAIPNPIFLSLLHLQQSRHRLLHRRVWRS